VNLVGFDTALATTSACVVRDDGQSFRTPAPTLERLLGPARHSQELLATVEGLLDDAGMGWETVDSIAVGVGPGTFTGLRIGVTTARALAQARSLALRPVSSLEALAAGVAVGARLAVDRRVLALIDARRGQVFAALFRVAERGSGDERVLEPESEPSVVDPERVLESVANLQELGDAPVCAGDWAIESRTQLERAGAEIPPADCGFHAVDALQVCRIGMSVRPVPPDTVQPVYLRLPDAEINRRLARLRSE
jgi:tRNA threonylcarbamoyladenosine biosynthesis protein TsaB